jgi:hypothetical protein
MKKVEILATATVGIIDEGPGLVHHESVRRTIAFGFLCLLHASNTGAAMPSELADAARNVGLSSDGIADVEQEPAVWVVEQESGERRVTVVGLAKLSASPGAILRDLRRRNGMLRSDALRYAGRFSTPPQPADVAGYRLPESDLEALSECEVGDCKFKLRAVGVEAFGKIDWSAPDARERADALAREGLLDFVRSYRKSGREALKTPFVDKEEPLSPGKGIDALLGHMQQTTQEAQALRLHLRDYPRGALEGAEDLIIWTVRDYGYRPVTGVIHAVIHEQPGSIPVVALKNLYSSHYFHARLQLIVLLADPEDPEQTYLGYSDRLLFDDDVGSIKRRMIEAGVLNDVGRRLELLRKAVE